MACDFCKRQGTRIVTDPKTGRTVRQAYHGPCHPRNHSPGGIEDGTVAFRVGKTKRDKASGAWARRLANRRARGVAQSG